LGTKGLHETIGDSYLFRWLLVTSTASSHTYNRNVYTAMGKYN